MISRALLNAPFFIPKDADLLRNRKVNTKKRQNRHLPELAFLILGTYFTAPFLKFQGTDYYLLTIIAHQFLSLLLFVGLSFFLAIKITSKLSNFILHQFEGLHKLWDTPLFCSYFHKQDVYECVDCKFIHIQ